MVACKIEAQLEYVHVAYTFCMFGTVLYAQLALINKISASELNWKFNKGPLLVGYNKNHLCFTLAEKYCNILEYLSFKLNLRFLGLSYLPFLWSTV